MSTAGPELPPHLIAKRKRQQEQEAEDSSYSPGPVPLSRPRSSSASSTSSTSKRRRILGPSLPPAPLSELPTIPPSNNSDSDDFGPSLPPSPGRQPSSSTRRREEAIAAETAAAAAAAASKKPQREEWMLVPPKQDDWTARVDPTKLRNRKFNAGKGSKAPPPKGEPDNALWTETPEQKRRRLEDEVMGVKKPALAESRAKPGLEVVSAAEAKATARRIREYNEKNRNTALLAEHKKVGSKEKEDDPSARAFDKEKDVGLGVKIGHAQKREMLSRAKDFGDRFAGGKYL